MSGQNNPKPPPGFINHFVAKYDSEIYDPSYETGPFGTELAWEKDSKDGYRTIFVLVNQQGNQVQVVAKKMTNLP